MTFAPLLLEQIDQQRAQGGFYALTELIELCRAENQILDPFSTLISRSVAVGTGNRFYPNVLIEAAGAGRIQIGDRNLFYPGTVIIAGAGVIRIGSGNQFGEGGVSLRADGPADRLIIADEGRYMHGAQISGSNQLGAGSQVLGPIIVRGCELGGGGGHREPDPDLRGGVLKGAGLASGLAVGQGEVINGRAAFAMAMLERQRAYHP
ncbi:MAG TPA: hypothetical protein VD886_16530 [Herpetosiphonaceae bacterium]|nr:hypothetical protein [Herpetosiphonaceae bacterium]